MKSKQEWKKIPISKIATVITGFPFKSRDFSLNDDDIRLLRGDNVIQGSIRWNNAKRWSKHNIEPFSEYLLSENDIVLAMDRPWINAGLKYARISKNDLPCLLVQRVSCLKAKENTNQKFLKYVIGSNSFTEYVLSIQTGSAIPHISKKQIEEFEFLVPDLKTQEKITKILSDLDTKILNLQNQNRILEQTAQAIFQSWFVDFDGVTEFEDSELGKIPKGWSIEKLGNIAELKSGFAFKSTDYVDEGIFLLRTKNFSQTEYVMNDERRYLPLDFYEKFKNFQLKKFDILLIMVGASVGNLGFITSNVLPALQNQNMWNVRARNSKQQLFLKYLIKKIVSSNIGVVAGSARDFFKKDFFREIRFIKPSDKILLDFYYLVNQVYEKINSNITQIQLLTQTRDTLLPKLMSGEIRV